MIQHWSRWGQCLAASEDIGLHVAGLSYSQSFLMSVLVVKWYQGVSQTCRKQDYTTTTHKYSLSIELKLLHIWDSNDLELVTIIILFIDLFRPSVLPGMGCIDYIIPVFGFKWNRPHSNLFKSYFMYNVEHTINGTENFLRVWFKEEASGLK
jgi:hypothetical protein